MCENIDFFVILIIRSDLFFYDIISKEDIGI